MGVENIKRWQWALIGLVAGLLYTYSWQGNEPDSSEHMGQLQFDREVLSKSRATGKPLLQDIVVHPAIQDFHHSDAMKVQLVTGMRLRLVPELKAERPFPFAFIAHVPYVPLLVPNGAQVTPTWTVMDFLAAAHKAHPEMNYRFAWETKPTTSMLIWGGAGLFIVGGIWPTILNLLVSGGMGTTSAPAEEEYDLSRFGKGQRTASSKVKVSSGMAEQDRQRLNALNDTLEAQLDAAGIVHTDTRATPDDSGADMASPDGGGVRPLTEGAAEPVVIGAQEHALPETYEELKKKFDAGVFYPVAHGTQKKP